MYKQRLKFFLLINAIIIQGFTSNITNFIRFIKAIDLKVVHRSYNTVFGQVGLITVFLVELVEVVEVVVKLANSVKERHSFIRIVAGPLLRV